jgi:hypothetical protein
MVPPKRAKLAYPCSRWCAARQTAVMRLVVFIVLAVIAARACIFCVMFTLQISTCPILFQDVDLAS